MYVYINSLSPFDTRWLVNAEILANPLHICVMCNIMDARL